MRTTDAAAELRSQLEGAALDPLRLEPWEAWKTFKKFLLMPSDAADEGIAVQFSREQTREGHFLVYLTLVRQFTEWRGDREIPVRYVGIELAYRPEDLRLENHLEVWSYDFPVRAAFAAHVEGLALFQRALTATPIATEVVGEEI